ncbi:unnamed protein product [Rotaria sordida]|uniref:Metalloendopeptidase n=1 Tax=Rotaria sordida TaxID=392033 RepID=A0A814T8U0_9BILA|nr:unnamed protein product [Rotaria sordida]CAF1073551.1 unnamed protein product [Rotaria sordida]CAF1090272.1 unnamed protein product [Rotaria sordida]CAF1156763.1 unnamed protein product [Rotaria sordida]CAF1261149.1 unnamed protein product [Rotaria sordida]
MGVPNLFNLPNISKNNRTDINLVEGDIAIPADKNRIAFTQHGPWPNGIVPYELHGYFSASHKTMITNGMKKISELTNNCIRFVDRGSNRVWLNIYPGQGCWSYMGKTKTSGAQDFSLELPGCIDRGVILHEILHALGFAHEQTRPDRDHYVRINRQNILSGQEHNFDRYTASQVNMFGTAYDYASIMHYRTDAFSRNGQPTIQAIYPGYEGWDAQMGRGSDLSAQDLVKLKKYYNCP